MQSIFKGKGITVDGKRFFTPLLETVYRLPFTVYPLLLPFTVYILCGCSVDPVSVEMPTDLPNTISGQIYMSDGEPAARTAVRMRRTDYLADTSRSSLTKKSIFIRQPYHGRNGVVYD
jgi:hypothetical protein